MTATDPPVEATLRPMIFLLGPPGAGKTVFGGRACKELGLGFRDLADAPVAVPADAGDLDRLSRLVADRAADVIELPWPLQQERRALALARRSGVPLLLWAHPEDMQARSGHAEPLFTPVPSLHRLRNGANGRKLRARTRTR